MHQEIKNRNFHSCVKYTKEIWDENKAKNHLREWFIGTAIAVCQVRYSAVLRSIQHLASSAESAFWEFLVIFFFRPFQALCANGLLVSITPNCVRKQLHKRLLHVFDFILCTSSASSTGTSWRQGKSHFSVAHPYTNQSQRTGWESKKKRPCRCGNAKNRLKTAHMLSLACLACLVHQTKLV